MFAKAKLIHLGHFHAACIAFCRILGTHMPAHIDPDSSECYAHLPMRNWRDSTVPCGDLVVDVAPNIPQDHYSDASSEQYGTKRK